MIFSLVALPELMPTTYPQLRQGTIEIWAKSTSGELVNPLVSDMQVTITSMAIHRVGVGEGSWISLLDSPSRVNPVEIAETPVSLKEAKVPIGGYNLLAFTFGEATVTIATRNVTLKSPAQELRVSSALTVSEGRRNSLVVDLSFDGDAIVASQKFDPYLTVTVERPGHAPVSTIASLALLASLGPDTVSPGESKSSTFIIESGSAVDGYLVHAEGGSGIENTFDLEIVETGELWYELTGSLWFVGGNLTAGTYTMTVYGSDLATTQVRFAVQLYRVPRITQDLPDVGFSGFVPAASSVSAEVNEFALYLDEPGLYDFYLGVKSGDYEFLVDYNPRSATSRDQILTLQLERGLHTFQIFTDFSGSGRDTSWSVGVVPVPSETSPPLTKEAMIASGLLVVSTVLFVAEVSFRRLRRRGSAATASKTERNGEVP